MWGEMLPGQMPMDTDDDDNDKSAIAPAPSMPLFWHRRVDTGCAVCERLKDKPVMKGDLNLFITVLICMLDENDSMVGEEALRWLREELHSQNVPTDIIDGLDGEAIASHVANCVQNTKIMPSRIYRMVCTLMCDQLQNMTNRRGQITKDAAAILKSISDMALKWQPIAAAGEEWGKAEQESIRSHSHVTTVPKQM
jgi:hypothetical protein